MILKGQKGFTLLEIMVAITVLGVLTGVVSTSVAGAKGASQEGQVQSDGKSAQSGVDLFNIKSIKSTFPDTSEALGGLPENRYTPAINVGLGSGLGVALMDKGGNQVGNLASTIKTAKGEEVPARSILNFDTSTDVYREDGRIAQAVFVPDFLLKEPGSLDLEAAETKDLRGNPFLEYLWLLKLNSPGSQQEGRTVEVYRLSSAVCYSGGVDPLSVQGQAEAAFKDIRGAADTATISAAAAAYVGAVTLEGAAITVAGHPSLRKAGLDLKAANTAHASAITALKDAAKALATAEAALANAQAALGQGGSPSTADRDAKRAARDNAQGALNGAGAAQAAAQTVRQRAAAIAARAQAEAATRATAAGAKCSGDNTAVALTYSQVF